MLFSSPDLYTNMSKFNYFYTTCTILQQQSCRNKSRQQIFVWPAMGDSNGGRPPIQMSGPPNTQCQFVHATSSLSCIFWCWHWIWLCFNDQCIQSTL